MSLLSEIQAAAAANAEPVPQLLRKSQLLAQRLDAAEFYEWATRELNGYPSCESLPAYRVISDIDLRGNLATGFVGSFGESPVANFLADGEDLKGVVMPGIKAAIGLVQEAWNNRREGKPFVLLEWSAKNVNFLNVNVSRQRGIHQSYNKIRQVVPYESYLLILEAVRTEIMRFTFDMEKQHPEAIERKPAGDSTGGDSKPLPRDGGGNIHFHTVFQGSADRVVLNVGNVTQTANVSGPQDAPRLNVDLASLVSELQIVRAKLSEEADPKGMEAAVEVRKAELEAAKPEPDHSKIIGFLAKAGTVAMDLITKIAAPIAVQAIELSLGIGAHH